LERFENSQSWCSGMVIVIVHIRRRIFPVRAALGDLKSDRFWGPWYKL